jgi:hypothetical protein
MKDAHDCGSCGHACGTGESLHSAIANAIVTRMMRNLATSVLVSSLAFAQLAHGDEPQIATRKVLDQLAVAFAKKDRPTIGKLIFDGWSGFRFTSTWGDANWLAAAKSLREATLQSASRAEATYQVKVGDRPREVKLLLGERGWQLDYNSFMGPFPEFRRGR